MRTTEAGLVDLPEDYRWSNAVTHLAGLDDSLVANHWQAGVKDFVPRLALLY